MLYRLGRRKEAEPLLAGAVQALEKQFGPEHPRAREARAQNWIHSWLVSVDSRVQRIRNKRRADREAFDRRASVFSGWLLLALLFLEHRCVVHLLSLSICACSRDGAGLPVFGDHMTGDS